MSELVNEEVNRDQSIIDEASDDESESSHNSCLAADVQLGFLEKESNILFLNKDWHSWDGGKVGGLPVWLDYTAIPSSEDVQCSVCNESMSFLLEIYSPLDNVENAFHRAIYVFCCRNPICVKSNRGFKCLRSQLPKINSMFSADTSTLSDSELSVKTLPETVQSHLCALCGCRAKSICSRCRLVRYCGKLHQRQHWKSHKLHCSEDGKSIARQEELDASQQGYLFPEYAIVVEPEDVNLSVGAETASASANTDSTTANTEKLLQNVPKDVDVWDDAVTSGGADEEIDRKITQKDYNKALSEKKYDPTYINFLTRIERGGSQQILRYNASSLHRSIDLHEYLVKDNLPLELQEHGRLYVSQEVQNKPNRVPPCPFCGSPRVFEFQIMPQILHYLGVDKNTQVSIEEEELSEEISTNSERKAVKKSGKIQNRRHDDLDWGTIDIYTCLASCDSRTSISEATICLQSDSRYLLEHVELQEIPDLILPPSSSTEKLNSASKAAVAVASDL